MRLCTGWGWTWLGQIKVYWSRVTNAPAFVPGTYSISIRYDLHPTICFAFEQVFLASAKLHRDAWYLNILHHLPYRYWVDDLKTPSREMLCEPRGISSSNPVVSLYSHKIPPVRPEKHDSMWIFPRLFRCAYWRFSMYSGFGKYTLRILPHSSV